MQNRRAGWSLFKKVRREEKKRKVRRCRVGGHAPPCPPPCWAAGGRATPPGVGWWCQSMPFGVGMSPGCTGMPQGPPAPICVKPAIRACGARFSGPLPPLTLWPRTPIVRNPAIPARALLPRETDIRDLGALATEVQKQQKTCHSLAYIGPSHWQVFRLRTGLNTSPRVHE